MEKTPKKNNYGTEICVNNCNETEKHKYELDNICYDTCPEGTFPQTFLRDETISIKDIDVSKYTNNLLNIFGDNNKQDSTSVLNSTVDIGGICGYSQGVIVSCTNESLVGYEHVGYNVGGIVGRQNGYVQMCVNNGEVFGRKDVGGIAGQAEP